MHETIRTLLLRHWGLRGALSVLPGYEDQNFAYLAEDGTRLVVKLAAAGRPARDLDHESRILSALAAGSLKGSVPELLPSADGQTLVEVQLPGEGRRLLRVLTWVDGELLSEVRDRPLGVWASLGDLLARVGVALAPLASQVDERSVIWDLRRASAALDDIAILMDDDLEAVARYFALQYLAHTAEPWCTLPQTVIHNDANEYNLTIRRDDGGQPCVTGLFDFGDSCRSYRVAELAIAGAYATLDAVDWEARLVALVVAYDAICPLRDDELAALFPLLTMRLVMSAINAARTITAKPGHDYVLVHQSAVHRALRAFRCVAPRSVESMLRTAVGRPLAPRPAALGDRRRRLLGGNLSLSFDEPLTVLRGSGSFLFDDEGRAHLDGVNNVCHVGHCHPRVVEAASRQMAILNTNTRFLHPAVLDLAEALGSTLPGDLSVVWFVNSGSEANELALRLARASTGRRGVLVHEHAYHGNTSTLIDVSPYKCLGPGGQGLPDWVAMVACPDAYRGRHRGMTPATGRAYARDATAVLDELANRPCGVAAFFSEGLLATSGQIVPPPDYLAPVFAAVRKLGGLCVADEVQTGLGRAGDHWWTFEAHGVIPDIVTIGKPFGNGHPLAAVVTTPEVAQAFCDGMEYFNTFGGNPVSAAVGLAVLDVIESEGLRVNASRVGLALIDGFRRLAATHALIGDVRGLGLYLGVEFVADAATREPAPRQLHAVVESMRRSGYLLSTEGPHDNVLKLKPPIRFSHRHARLLLESFDQALTEVEGVMS
ncbi:MAG: aminotransferase class III-fold pyridoxal phosphate-dependent enzyme [Planctomycetes bacterium]|nr:aminotransferase class III-fold pyridoxal phosphate-dependent enzyme [Planctomycetota bacterium]